MTEANITIQRDGFDLTISVSGIVHPGTHDYYDSSIGGPGGWSSGNPPEVEDIGGGEVIEYFDEDGDDALMPAGMKIVLTPEEEWKAGDALIEARENDDDGPDPDRYRD